MSKSMIVRAVSITGALALLGGATFANFSSAASNNANTFGAGTMVLKINDQQPTSTGVFSLSDKAPGYVSNYQVLDLKNDGSVAAATVTLTGITVAPNAAGDLGEVLTLDLYKDVNNNGAYDGGDTLIHSGHLNHASWAALPLGFGIGATSNQNILAKLTFDSSATNSYQGKSVSFDMAFQEDQ
jgi:predicted ribosomally synthesized peptide with SipW-like signal peptide